MRTSLYYIGIGLILVLFLNSSGPNLDTFIPGNPWEHYCKYELHKHPFHTNEKESISLILLLARINMNK
jgi:hypothetical protein